ncbi:hypothetical protein Tco_1189900 [Tanacetum coccineum]
MCIRAIGVVTSLLAKSEVAARRFSPPARHHSKWARCFTIRRGSEEQKDKRLKIVMSADSAVTYTSVHSEARSWSIPSEDPYEEAARQLLE